jgi:hypothetical protein
MMLPMDPSALSARIFYELDADLPNDGHCLIRKVQATQGWAEIYFVTVTSAIPRRDASPNLEEAIHAIVGRVLGDRRVVVLIDWA